MNLKEGMVDGANDKTKEFWNNRYLNNDIGWDMGEVSPPIKEYINQLKDKKIKILIPGGGNSYEAEYIHSKGFNDVTVVDIAPQPLINIKKRAPNFPKKKLQCGDFFSFTGQFDLIIEQTFFCAIDKKMREKYAHKTASLLKENGKLVGVMFNAPLNENYPPFGGSVEEYLGYFEPYFKNISMIECYNSHPSRKGREIWVKMTKK